MRLYETKLLVKIDPNNKLAFNGSSNMITYTEEFKGELFECRKSLKSSLENIGCQFTVFNADLKTLISLLHIFEFAIDKVEKLSDKYISKHKGEFKFVFQRKGINVRITIHIDRIK